jgi:endonuclease-3
MKLCFQSKFREDRGMEKRPHDIPRMFALIRKAIEPYPKATLFDLYDRGYQSPFEQLVACVLSIRTRDETSLKVALKLFERARTPKEFLEMNLEELADIVQLCTFPFQKAKSLLQISEIVLQQYAGKLPCDFESLTALPGIGPKCASLIRGIACDEKSIGVDIHVHRITNRWGYVQASTPEKTMIELEKKLPKSRWVEINELLVPFGKHICTGPAPKCPTCPVLDYCAQIGVHVVSSKPRKQTPSQLQTRRDDNKRL